MLFSIIIPVYQVEDYIKRCLESVKKQTYANFEVIIVDDGSKDRSIEIARKVIQNDARFRIFQKENGGLSDARNYGVKKAQGDYLLFLDSDDYWEKELLEQLQLAILKEEKPDMVRFQVIEKQEDNLVQRPGVSFDRKSGYEAMKELTTCYYFEPAWLYAYARDFWMKGKFQYAKGRYHEDFGLTPYVLLKAKSVVSIPYYGYYYVIRENSIVTSKSIEKTRKKIQDVLYFYDSLKKKVEEDSKIKEEEKKFFSSYLANALLNKAKEVPKEDWSSYKKELKERKVYLSLREETMGQKLKKILVHYFLSLYLKFFQ